jgi:hypothetical protein
MRRLRASLGVLILTAGAVLLESPAAAFGDSGDDLCCDQAFQNLLQAQSAETRDRFKELRLHLATLGEDDFTWLQITAASDEPICRVMECNGIAESVAKQLIALQAIEREAAEDSRFAAQDRRLNFLVAAMAVITTVVGLGSLCIAYLAYRQSRRSEFQNA